MTATDLLTRHRNKKTLAVYYGLCGLVILAGGGFLLLGSWESALSTFFIFLLMLVPSVLRGRYRLYLPFVIELGMVIFIFLTLFLGSIAHFYQYVPLWDKFLHFQSGILLGATGFVLIYILNEHETLEFNMSPGFVTIFAIAFSLAIGVVWEIIEFSIDGALGKSVQHGNSDTMWDLIAAGIGAAIVSLIGYFWMKRHKRLPLTPWNMK